tara:strand:- start:1591 stop:1722 length:132 start_codon:yes stop_codon:yes gene_type:complete
MKQTKKSIESFYKQEDSWGFKVNPDDIKRKEIIIDKILKMVAL